MNLKLEHRGPDTGGIQAFRTCVLGHRRLSIVDLSDTAKQPMLSVDGMVALVFNGEIYNFQEIRGRLKAKGRRFRTKSDTEVILELYLEKREALLDDLNGMFSIAIWDDRDQRLFMARDRVGKKPFYYYYGNGRFCFSSELFSLVQNGEVPRTLSHQALCEYLLYDFIPGPHSIFEGVCKLPPAHMAILDAHGLRVEKYWETPTIEDSHDFEGKSSELTELLTDSVQRRLIADVPLGSFLSGGIDSTLVTALMSRRNSERVKTFSISFPGTSHDEARWSRLAANALGTDHREYAVEYDITTLLSKMIPHFGEPFGDSSAIPTWHLCRHTREHVTVALSGDGGDELFGGYERYLARRLQTVYDMVPNLFREYMFEPLIESLPATTDYYGTSIIKKLKLFVQAAARVRNDPLAVVPRTFSVEEVRVLTGLEYTSDTDPVITAARQWVGLDPVSRMLFTDIQTYLAEDILTKVDRMSMAHALEVRSPLLDYRVIEFACRLPLRFKIRNLATKRILRHVAQPYVPESILKRSKYGFQVPLGLWFKTHLKGWARERLLEGGHGFFQKDKLELLWNQHQSAACDHTHRIWLLIFFNEWYAQLHG
ncbi:MAG TPA: asparagine synthase (glutamine-hydrolyzing) [Desulfomonilaceae bacterium]|nr:asparagine synthase (glutamine-hydrolyzing) [Desulfomonilaceae bacterium]